MRELSSNGQLFNVNMSQFDLEMRCIWAISLAQQLISYGPDLTKENTLTVVVAGAEGECLFTESYQLLNRILGTNITWHIILVGINAEQAASTPLHLSKPYRDDRVYVEVIKSTLGEHLSVFPKVDFVSINNPGLIRHEASWFLDDTGIAMCIDKGIKVAGGSHGMGEFGIDSLIFKKHKMHFTQSCSNPLSVEIRAKNFKQALPRDSMSALDKGCCDSSFKIWQLGELTDSIVEKDIIDLERGYELMAQRFNEYHEDLIAMNLPIELALATVAVGYLDSSAANEILLSDDLIYDFGQKSVQSLRRDNVLEDVQCPKASNKEDLKDLECLYSTIGWLESYVDSNLSRN
ncbi:hypothetical protein V6259_12595 [Marinomonas sp. TI.3.20]|uniref:hypothetical protein n=1 Tax=Marinomonas sp. TI.3.20 TaxID=3121296 RepID=UPI00311F8D6A